MLGRHKNDQLWSQDGLVYKLTPKLTFLEISIYIRIVSESWILTDPQPTEIVRFWLFSTAGLGAISLSSDPREKWALPKDTPECGNYNSANYFQIRTLQQLQILHPFWNTPDSMISRNGPLSPRPETLIPRSDPKSQLSSTFEKNMTNPRIHRNHIQVNDWGLYITNLPFESVFGLHSSCLARYRVWYSTGHNTMFRSPKWEYK